MFHLNRKLQLQEMSYDFHPVDDKTGGEKMYCVTDRKLVQEEGVCMREREKERERERERGPLLKPNII